MKKVLLIDDIEEIRQLVKIILGKRNNYKVLVAEDAKEGIEMALSQEPDLILMDIFLPGTSGLEATLTLRNKYGYKKPIVLFSVLSELEGIAEKAEEVEADDYIHKPFKLENFVQKVETYTAQD